MITQLNELPQLSQVQYDTSSQLFYVNKALKAFGLQGLKTIPTLFSPDPQAEKVINQIKPHSAITDCPLLAYHIAVRLGMYDAADALRFT